MGVLAMAAEKLNTITSENKKERLPPRTGKTSSLYKNRTGTGRWRRSKENYKTT